MFFKAHKKRSFFDLPTPELIHIYVKTLIMLNAKYFIYCKSILISFGTIYIRFNKIINNNIHLVTKIIIFFHYFTT